MESLFWSSVITGASVDRDESTRGILNDKRLAGPYGNRRPLRRLRTFQVDPIHTSSPVYKGGSRYSISLLVRDVFHSHLYAGNLRMLPAGNRSRSSGRRQVNEMLICRPGRFAFAARSASYVTGC